MSEICDYCDGDELVYELEPARGGTVNRCLECLAIEQGQQKFSLPFERWIDQEMTEPPEHPDAPDFEPYDPREMDYRVARAWFRVLARIKDNKPILKREEDAIGSIADETRTFLTNLMGNDAYKRPSELRGQSDE